MEPEEFVIIDVDEPYAGKVIEKFGSRKGELKNMTPMTDGRTRLEFTIPARGLIGVHGELQTETRGSATMSHSFHRYMPWSGPIASRRNGVLISQETGVSTAYAMDKLTDRGEFFVEPGAEVYEGMILGECNTSIDLIINVCKGKKLSNMRASGSDDNIKLPTARKLSLEQSLEILNDDELAEITPAVVRLRKRFLNEEDRKRQKRTSQG